MATYPNLPRYMRQDADVDEVYNEVVAWANQLAQELNLRDNQVDSTPSTKVLAVVTVADIGRPSSGDIAFSLGESKFKGYVSGTGWVDFH